MTIERHVAQHLVLSCEQRFRTRHVSGAGSEATMSQESLGWYAILDNQLAVYVGSLDPRIPPNTCVTLALEIPRI